MVWSKVGTPPQRRHVLLATQRSLEPVSRMTSKGVPRGWCVASVAERAHVYGERTWSPDCELAEIGRVVSVVADGYSAAVLSARQRG